MNIQFKSFIHLLHRYPLPVLGNILGLAVAIAAFIIISMEVDYNRSFDGDIRDVDHLFELTAYTPAENSYDSHFSRPLCEALATLSPHIETVTFRNFYWPTKQKLVLNDTEINTDYCTVADNYFDVFGFDWIDCDTTAFTDPLACFLPESMALKFYGTTQLVKQPVNPSDPGRYIGGVYRDFPENSSVANTIYAYMGDENKGVQSNHNYLCYIKLHDTARQTDVEKAILTYATGGNEEETNCEIRLIPYRELHFRKDIPGDRTAVTVDPDTQYLFLFIAFAIILIACINFTNLYAAFCPLRIRSLNTQKVLGATRSSLIGGLVAETTLVCLVAWIVALILVHMAAQAGMSELQHASIRLASHPWLVAGSFALAVAMGVAAGLYPALYATSFQPALVLKGNFGLSPRGRSLRNTLVGIQFTTAFALFICVLNTWQQNDYMRHSELGYNQRRLINIPTRDIWQARGGLNPFVDGLKQLTAVEDVALSFNRLSSLETGEMSWGRNTDNDAEYYISFACMPVSENFLRTAGISITEGRDFNATDVGSYIFNEAARRKFEKLHLGTTLGGESIIGFCADFKFGNMHDEVTPMAFKLMNSPLYESWFWKNYIVVRVREGVTLDDALQAIRDYAAPLVEGRDIETLTQLDVLDITYAEDARQLKSLLIFCVLAVLICLTGVFGLVVFECEYRRKEIGVRKVLGAFTGSIIVMLCQKYAWILGISFTVAAPVAWYAVDTWLQGFAYRTEILPWTFIVPLVAVAAVTLLTVALQSYRTANANPVDSLRSE